MPERLGASYRFRELIEGPIRVTVHPGDQHRPELALHAGVGTRPIRELHVLIEHLEAPPKVRKRQLKLPLAVQRHAERHVRPDVGIAAGCRTTTPRDRPSGSPPPAYLPAPPNPNAVAAAQAAFTPRAAKKMRPPRRDP